MKGIESSEKLYREYFVPALQTAYPECKNVYAAGLVGHGSECFGWDDGLSLDHDVSNGFYIWLTDEDDIRYGVKLNRVYREIFGKYGENHPKSGMWRSERGVMTVDEFFLPYLGRRGLPETAAEWMHIPESALAEAVNGRVFFDGRGAFSEMREKLSECRPEDVRLKKAAASAALAAQAGQYNFMRCIKRGELGAAALSLAEFVDQMSMLIFLINDKFAPYYKWRLRGLSELPHLAFLADPLTELLTLETSEETADKKADIIETTCHAAADEMQRTGMSDAEGCFLEHHAFSVAAKIKDPFLRSLHIMEKGLD